MFPTIEISGYYIQTFLVCICAGFTLSSGLVFRQGGYEQLKSWWVTLWFFWVFGRLGNELLYNFPQSVSVNLGINGGSSILGSILGSMLVIPVIAMLRNISWSTLADSFILPLLVVQMFGKFGCFLNGCCCGVPTSVFWCVDFPAHPDVCIHPSQLYELTALLLMFGMFLMASDKLKAGSGVLTALYLVLYGLERFIAEFFRGDVVKTGFLGITVGQLASLLIVLCGFLIFTCLRRRHVEITCYTITIL